VRRIRTVTALTVTALLAAACGEPLPTGAGRDPELDRFAIRLLDSLQPESIRRNAEFCGFLGRDPAGAFAATEPEAGYSLGCDIYGWPEDFVPVASYHTHSAFDHEADSEVPSPEDVQTDVEDRVFGYVSTPGGRVWLIDWRTRTATQICGTGCVTADPNFVEGDAGPIARSYTLRELRRRQGGLLFW
jgi:hypothetical protein